MSKRIGHFDILKRMSEKSRDIRMSPIANITNLQVVHKGRDTKITIGFGGNVLTGICNGDLIGGLILTDKKQYFETKAELEREAEGN
jgi:hypothetical protein